MRVGLIDETTKVTLRYAHASNGLLLSAVEAGGVQAERPVGLIVNYRPGLSSWRLGSLFYVYFFDLARVRFQSGANIERFQRQLRRIDALS